VRGASWILAQANLSSIFSDENSKSEARNPKQIQIANDQNSKPG